MILRLLVFTIWLWALILTMIGCSSSEETSPVGEVKISYFAIVKGMMSKQPVGSYLALISKEWLKKYGRKLNEPFEKLRLHPGRIAIKSVPDEEMRELIREIKKLGFYSLPSISLDQYTLDVLERPDFTTQVITMEINGHSHSVAAETLPPDKIQTFLNIFNVFVYAFSVIDDPLINVTLEDTSSYFKRQFSPSSQPSPKK